AHICRGRGQLTIMEALLLQGEELTAPATSSGIRPKSLADPIQHQRMGTALQTPAAHSPILLRHGAGKKGLGNRHVIQIAHQRFDSKTHTWVGTIVAHAITVAGAPQNPLLLRCSLIVLLPIARLREHDLFQYLRKTRTLLYWNECLLNLHQGEQCFAHREGQRRAYLENCKSITNERAVSLGNLIVSGMSFKH